MKPRFPFSFRAQQPGQAGWLLFALLLFPTLSAFAQTTSFTTVTNGTTYATTTGTQVTATDVAGTGWDFTTVTDGTARVLGTAGTGQSAGALGVNDPFVRTGRTSATNNFIEGRVRRTAGTAFKLNSIYLQCNFSGPLTVQSITLFGYRGGSQVASLTQAVTTTATWSQFVTSSIAAFNNVDELRATVASTPNGGGQVGTVGWDEINITVAPANTAPSISNQTRSVAENSANGTPVGAAVTASDPDAGQTLTYAITAGNTGSVFAINSSTGQLTVAGALDFETVNSYALTVRVTDNAATPASSSATVTVSVTDVPAPTLTSLNPTSGPVGTSVTLTGTDFAGLTGVNFGSTAATTFAFVNATTATATVPAGASTGLVTISTGEGTSNGVNFTVTTAPTVTTTAPASITSTSATLGGNVTADGGATITERGVVYVAGSGTPTTSNTKALVATSGIVVGTAFSGTVSGLTASTQYTVRAYAINSVGTSYGSSQSFTTTAAASADLIISTGSPAGPVSIAAGTYNNITITSSGYGQLAGSAAVGGTFTVQGSLNTNCQPLTGSGSFTLAAGATLYVCDAAGLTPTGATGAVQTVTRTFSTDALYIYNGAAAQATGAGLPATVRSLTLTNAAGLTLTQAVAATTALAVTTGVLTTGSARATLGSAATLSETETAYVVGQVAATRTLAPGTAEPFGGLGLTLTPAAGSASPGATPVVRTTGTALTGAGSSTSVLRYFDIQPAVNTGLNVAMDFAYFTHELNGIAPANLALFKSETTTAGPWANQRPVTLNAGAKTVSKTGIADFSIWTLGNAQAPLPVELTAFTAERQGEAARLVWATASEKNSAYFEAEASLDGTAFRAVGRVAAKGNTAQRHDYELRDPRLLAYGAPLVYYRLRQVDLDGMVNYSPVRALAVSGGATGAALVLFPNPARGRVQWTGTEEAPAQLLDLAGRCVRTAPAGASALDLAGIPAGVYLLRCGAQSARLAVE